MMTIAGSVQEKKSLRMPQDRFSRGGWLLRYPPFRGASSTPSIMRLTFFANAKTMWTLPLLWTQRTRPQEFGNLAKNARFPQRPHRSSFSLKAKKEEQNHSDQLSTKSDHPQEGYISGVVARWPDQGQWPIVEVDTMRTFVATYCNAHPSATVADAGHAVIYAMLPNRVTPPK